MRRFVRIVIKTALSTMIASPWAGLAVGETFEDALGEIAEGVVVREEKTTNFADLAGAPEQVATDTLDQVVAPTKADEALLEAEELQSVLVGQKGLTGDGVVDGQGIDRGLLIEDGIQGPIVGETVLEGPGDPTRLLDSGIVEGETLFDETPGIEGSTALGPIPQESVGSYASEPMTINEPYDQAFGQAAPCEPMIHHHLVNNGCPLWAFQADALFLWRGNVPSRPLYVNTFGGTTVLDANQLDPGVSVGPRFGLFRQIGSCHRIEGNYFQVSPFSGVETTPIAMAALTQNDLSGFNQAGISQATAESYGFIQSAELNWRRQTGSIEWLAGFRWVEWNERLSIIDSGAMGIPNQFGTLTGNDLYGGQIGFDAMLWNANRAVQVNAIGKAGVFGNHAFQQSTAVVDRQGVATGLGPARAAADGIAFFGEVGANAEVAITDWLAWRVGYSVFWLSGVATAADQLSTTNLTTSPTLAAINTDGSVLLHGVTTGLEVRW